MHSCSTAPRGFSFVKRTATTPVFVWLSYRSREASTMTRLSLNHGQKGANWIDLDWRWQFLPWPVLWVSSNRWTISLQSRYNGEDSRLASKLDHLIPFEQPLDIIESTKAGDIHNSTRSSHKGARVCFLVVVVCTGFPPKHISTKVLGLRWPVFRVSQTISEAFTTTAMLSKREK